MDIKLLRKEHLESLRELWNQEMPKQFLLNKDVFQTQIVDSIDIDWHSSVVAIKNDQVIAGVVAKRWVRHGIDKYKNTAWISLIYVKQEYQKDRIGTLLLEITMERLREQDVNTIHIGKDMNNLFCGVPTSFQSGGFFLKKGFTFVGNEHDMHKHITTQEMIPLRQVTDYHIHVSTEADFPKMHAFFDKNFPGRWQQEFIEYVNYGGKGDEFVIIEKDDLVVAFCRINQSGVSQNMYNTNFRDNFENLYGIGPLGVDQDYRKYSLGFDVTAYTINHAVSIGASDIIIDWTNLVEFYEKFGFQVWHTYESYKKEV